MDQFEKDLPTRWALAFFRWFCNPEMKEYIEGDLLELYHIRQAGLGRISILYLLTKMASTRLQVQSISSGIKVVRSTARPCMWAVREMCNSES